MRLAVRAGSAVLENTAMIPLFIRKENKVLNLLLALPDPEERKAPYFEISMVDEEVISRSDEKLSSELEKQFKTEARSQALYHGIDLLEEVSRAEIEEEPEKIAYNYVEFDAEMACSILDIDTDAKKYGEEKFGKKKLQWRKIGNSESVELNITGPFEDTEGLFSTELSIDELSLVKAYIKHNIPSLMGWRRLYVPNISSNTYDSEDLRKEIDELFEKMTKKKEVAIVLEETKTDTQEEDAFKSGPLDFVKYKKELEKRKGDHPNKPVAEAKATEAEPAKPAEEKPATVEKSQKKKENKNSE